MKTKVEIINVEEVSGTSRNGPYKFQKCHCIIHLDGSKNVGILVPPKGIDNVALGEYEAEFGLAVDREQRIVGALKSLTPVKAAKDSPKAGSGAF